MKTPMSVFLARQAGLDERMNFSPNCMAKKDNLCEGSFNNAEGALIQCDCSCHWTKAETMEWLGIGKGGTGGIVRVAEDTSESKKNPKAGDK